MEYRGSITGTGESRGHYICDVKDFESNSWFRTNDNRDPVQIPSTDVSKLAYVVLFRRIQE